MGRNKRTKVDEKAAPSEVAVNPSVGAGGASSSAMRGIEQPTGAGLLVKELPGIVTNPINGKGYLSRRSRPWPDDERQYICTVEKHDIKGYWDVGSPTKVEPVGYDATEIQLEQSFSYLRQVCKFSRKPRLYKDELSTTGILARYYNTYYAAVRLLVTVFSLFKMLQFSEAFQAMSSYLPDRMIRAQRLWARLSALVVPAFLKVFAIKDGVIARGNRVHIPHVSWLAVSDGRELAGSSDETFGTDLSLAWLLDSNLDDIHLLYDIMTTATYVDDLLDLIELMVKALEGIYPGNSTIKGDIVAIKEVHEYASQAEGLAPKYSQGLPSLASLPGMVTDDAALNRYYCRALLTTDTKGAGADQAVAFPVLHMAGLGNLIPIKGWGAPSVEEFTLFGMCKFAASFGNLTNGTNYMSLVGVNGRLMGTLVPAGTITGAGEDHFAGREEIYTREDADEDLVGNATDFGDGASIRTFENTEHHWLSHIYSHSRYSAQLTTANLEFRFVDRAPVDYEFWAEPDDYPEAHVLFIAQSMGIPQLV